MNLKKKFRDFFTLTRKADGGFTLVELIVVIAIIAILAGVAVPAYSGYITKANKQADMSLVSDVAHALTLYYYNNSTNAAAGYVILQNGADATADEAGVGAAAMEKTFGSNWAQTATLKYGEWTDNGMLDTVASLHTSSELQQIADSSFLTYSSAGGMMNAVSNLTKLVSDVISEKTVNNGGIDKAKTHLNTLFGENEITDKLDTLEGDAADEYSTVISNMLVGFMADQVGEREGLQAIMNMYAYAFAYAEETGETAALDSMNETLKSVNMDILMADKDTGMGIMLGGMYNDLTGETQPGCEGFLENFNTLGMSGQFDKNSAALKTMMKAVKQISAGYNDTDDLTNPDLFTSGEVSEDVNNYLSAVKAMAGLDDDARAKLAGLDDGSIVVAVSADGVVSVVPSAAWLASEN